MTPQNLEADILQKITPTPEEKQKVAATIQELTADVQRQIEKTGLTITPTLVGSTAKDTFLRTSLDIDLFLLFPTDTPRDILAKTGLAIGRAILQDQEECFAEHPYLRGTYHGYKTEIVPAYHITSATQRLSAVDRTPLHTQYITTHLKETQKPDVLLFKQFLRGINCYGAEAEIEGFSGYLCEILILYYKSFHDLLTAAQHWKPGTILTLTPETEPPAFPESCLVFIDPVDPNRNVASALSEDTFDDFVTACHAYLKKPSTTFFFPNPICVWPLEKIAEELSDKKFIAVQIRKPDIIPENLYPQIRKTLRSLRELCDTYGYLITEANYMVLDDAIYFVLQTATLTLPQTETHMGPPTTLQDHVVEFKSKWSNNPRTVTPPYQKNGRWYVDIKREYPNIQDLIKANLLSLSLGKDIADIIRQHFTILERPDLLTPHLQGFWTRLLENKMPWDW
jgi:tRNA nucleotidyltransferase (CCA-adding enzyme)